MIHPRIEQFGSIKSRALVSWHRERPQVTLVRITVTREHELKVPGNNGPADSATKTLRQLHVKEDDEERFQADLKKAARQSLHTIHAHEKLPLLPRSRNGQNVFRKSGTLGNANSIGDVNVMDVYGTGLNNEVGEYNCFLSVIIQSLRRLRSFLAEFLRTSSKHVHVGDPCVICALYDIFTALSTASAEVCRVHPFKMTGLRDCSKGACIAHLKHTSFFHNIIMPAPSVQ